MINVDTQALVGIVHGLHDPLATILDLSQGAPQDSSELDERMRQIRSEAARSIEIIRSALNLPTNEVAECSVIDLNDLIHQTVDLAQFQLRRNRTGLSLTLPDPAPKVLANGDQFIQILLGLIVQAARTIGTFRGSGHVGIAAFTSADRVRVSVMDDGPGIPEEEIPQLFDPVVAIRDTANGLQLTIARNAMRQLGGDIWVTSHPLHGTTFTLDLPAAVETVTVPGAAGSDQDFHPSAPSVLIVDSERLIARLVESVLLERGRYSQSVSSGSEAMGLLEQGHYDLLVCDDNAPDIAGLELLHWIRATGSPTRVLLLSAGEPDFEVRNLVEGMGGQFLCRPFAIEDLVAAVNRVLAQ